MTNGKCLICASGSSSKELFCLFQKL